MRRTNLILLAMTLLTISYGRLDAQGVEQLWLNLDLGDKRIIEQGNGIGIDHSGCVYVTGTTFNLREFDLQKTIYNDIDLVDVENDLPYGSFSQVLYKLHQDDGRELVTPITLATCNAVGDDEPDDGSANDISVRPTGEFTITGTCNFETGPFSGAKELYVRRFPTFGSSGATTGIEDTELVRYLSHAIAETPDAVYVVGAIERRKSPFDVDPDSDIFVAKFTSFVGPPEEMMIFGTDEDEVGNGIDIAANGDVYISGVTQGDFAQPFCLGGGQHDIVVMRLNGDLDEIWRQQFDASEEFTEGCTDEIACSIAVGDSVSDGGETQTVAYVAGRYSIGTESSGLLLRYNENGEREWARALGGPDTPVSELSANEVIFTDVDVDTLGGVYVVGTTDGSITPDASAEGFQESAFFARYDDSNAFGEFQWAEQLEFVGTSGYSIFVDNRFVSQQNPDIYITGRYVQTIDDPTLENHIDCGFVDDSGLVAFDFDNSQTFAGKFRAAGAPNILKGDVNCDGLINLLDVPPFVDKISNNIYCEKADVNCDGEVNILDVPPFVDLLTP